MNFVDEFAVGGGKNARLYCIGADHGAQLTDHNSSAPFFRQLLSFIFVLHVHLPEVTEVVPEPWEVLFKNPAEELGVGLTNYIVKGVAVDEGLFDT